MKNYYKILKVSRDATREEIRKSYRSLARQSHPDINKNPEHEKIFQEISEAYKILSDSAKRAEYDEELLKGENQGINEPENSKKNPPSKTQMLLAALVRAIFAVFAGVLAGIAFEFIIWVLGKNPKLTLTLFYPSMFWGGLVGLFLGIDLNFDIEGFLESKYLGRIYAFSRTFFYALSFSYFGGKLFWLISFFYKKAYLSLVGILIGLVCGAAFGSDAEGLFKLKNRKGRLSLFYASLRAIEIGLVGLFMGVILGLVVQFLASNAPIFWFAFTGFSLGVILGGFSSFNLASYASYASASVKNFLVILIVMSALILGIIFGYLFHQIIQDFLKIF